MDRVDSALQVKLLIQHNEEFPMKVVAATSKEQLHEYRYSYS